MISWGREDQHAVKRTALIVVSHLVSTACALLRLSAKDSNWQIVGVIHKQSMTKSKMIIPVDTQWKRQTNTRALSSAPNINNKHHRIMPFALEGCIFDSIQESRHHCFGSSIKRGVFFTMSVLI